MLNLTAGNLIVKMGEGDSVGVTVPSKCSRHVTANLRNTFYIDTLKITTSVDGEVEVQCVEY